MLVGNTSRKDILKTQKQGANVGRKAPEEAGGNGKRTEVKNSLYRSKCLFQADGKTATDVQT